MRVVYLDASDSGYCVYSVKVGPQIAHGSWSAHEGRLSSTWRELKVVYPVLCSLARPYCKVVHGQSECDTHGASGQ